MATIEWLQKVLPSCHDNPLLEQIQKAIEVFSLLPKDKKYSINFSGGKDSHVLLGVFILWRLSTDYKYVPIQVSFADTKLETNSLYKVVTKAWNWSTKNGIAFKSVKSKQSYWFVQYALGYPVPDYFLRWCTSTLKVYPLTKDKRIPITELPV